MKIIWLKLYYDGASDAALISGSAQLAGTALSVASASGANAKQRQFMHDMYDIQRKDALSDRDYANQYNLPSAQMERLKAAGLNPNLIYGKAGADMASSPVRSSDFPSYQPRVPDYSGVGKAGESIMNYFQVQSQQSQLANMAAQRALIEAEKDKVVAETPGAQAESGIRQVNLNVAQATQQAKIDYENGQPVQLQANIAKTLTDTTVEQLKALPSVELMVTQAAKNIADTEVLQSRKMEINQMVENLKKTGILQGLEIQSIHDKGMKIGTAGQMWTLASMILNKLFPDNGPAKPLPKGMNPTTGETDPYRSPYDPAP